MELLEKRIAFGTKRQMSQNKTTKSSKKKIKTNKKTTNESTKN